ncbi:ribonuclease J [Helicobacter sp. 12S02634-8]|uniref:ribonuclease J n=1 Tax=Helicobacter sp. 12S02634-8 TaxID=1476199 RepID=UPI000BA79C8C|nr:ribonuclease J [Helicobacter sp. 12S02634-8]PAF47753.1 ribonuclease J [Helicobacter sp. 12S02634-8]
MENNNENSNQTATPPNGQEGHNGQNGSNGQNGQRRRFFKPRFKKPQEDNETHTENPQTRPRRWIGKNKNTPTNPNTQQNSLAESKDGIRDIQSVNERGNLGFHKDLKKGVEANTRIQKNSLNPHFKLNLNTKAKVRITPLGGLGEIGGNMMVMETEQSAIIIDVGMSFPEENMHGVDILIPDFSYLHAIKDKIAGVVITHAHEDHIGAVPYLYKQMQFPLYGTPLALGMIGNKFDEHGLKKYRSFFKIVEKRYPIKIGDFEIEWIHITHSIIDASALAIRTEAGIIVHTGDFKIDHTPIDNLPTDLHRLAHYGEEGVMLLLSDSTNSHKIGVTASEASVGPTFDNLFKGAEGRVIMSTFSSNIHRVYQAITYGIKYNRKVAVIGRSMEKNLDIARELGYIDLPYNIFIEAHEVSKYPDEEVLIVTTGSQGETMSALYRMATDEHRHIKIKPTDMVIISAKAIPGNEGSVSTVLNFLMKAGARVAYQDFSEIHVSGHAAQEEQKLMLRLIKPKFFLPVHGEYNHVAKHRDTAIKCGVPEKNIYLMEDGDQIEVNPSYIRKVRTIKSGKTYIDNQVNRQIDNHVVADRQALADCGMVLIIAFISSQEQKLLKNTRITTLGIAGFKEEKDLAKEIENALEMYIKTLKKEVLTHQKTLENEVRNLVRKLMFKKLKKYPTIMSNIFVS